MALNRTEPSLPTNPESRNSLNLRDGPSMHRTLDIGSGKRHENVDVNVAISEWGVHRSNP